MFNCQKYSFSKLYPLWSKLEREKWKTVKTGPKSDMVDYTSYGKAEQINCQRGIKYSN